MKVETEPQDECLINASPLLILVIILLPNIESVKKKTSKNQALSDKFNYNLFNKKYNYFMGLGEEYHHLVNLLIILLLLKYSRTKVQMKQ